MKDYIFVTGASGIGKSTLCNGILQHYNSTCVEQHMIPEFFSRDGIEPMTGELEELTIEIAESRIVDAPQGKLQM